MVNWNLAKQLMKNSTFLAYFTSVTAITRAPDYYSHMDPIEHGMAVSSD